MINAEFAPYKILLLNTNVSHNLVTLETNSCAKDMGNVATIPTWYYYRAMSFDDLIDLYMTSRFRFKPIFHE